MSLFNSLGSNYSSGFFLKAFTSSDYVDNSDQLKKYLSQRYGGDVTLLYKGRDAIRLALRALDFQDAAVAICGFTCFAVYEAITKEGYNVEYLDIDSSLNYSLETFKKALRKNPKIKVLILQNTLGYPAEGERIATFCKEKGIVLIEDLAHCIGTTYENKQEAGTLGDMVVFSFSQDKVVDAISGGALVIRNANYEIKKQDKVLSEIPYLQQRRDRYYPLLTTLIRATYSLGIGKVLHSVLKSMKLLQSPMENQKSDTIYSLPHWQAHLVYEGYKNLNQTATHRKKIAKIYADTLPKSVLETDICDRVSHSSNLRFPIFVANREDLFLSLKKKHMYISDTWYDAPISPKKYLARTDYKEQCPNSEKIADIIVNLPTHQNISENEAQVLVEEIKQWLK